MDNNLLAGAFLLACFFLTFPRRRRAATGLRTDCTSHKPSSMAIVNYTYYDEGDDGNRISGCLSLPGFIEVLDRTRVRNRRNRGRTSSENGGSRLHGHVSIDLGLGTRLDELRDFSAWLEGNALDPDFQISARQIRIRVHDLKEGHRLWPVLMQHLQSLLHNLLSLGDASALVLEMRPGCEPPRDLVPSLLDALPRCGTLKALHLKLGTFDACTVQALMRAIPNLRLDDLHLHQGRPRPGAPERSNHASNIIRAALDGELSRLAWLTMHDFDLTTIDAGCWKLLSANRMLKKLRLECDLGVHAFELLASALTSNTSLRELVLCDHTAQGRCNAFAGTLVGNTSLKRLVFKEAHVLESDLLDLTQGLRRNGTLRQLEFLCNGLTPPRLQPLIETVRYHNITLEYVGLPSELRQEQQLLDAACQFHRSFRIACQSLQDGTTVPSDAVFRRWWPLLGSKHFTAKATVLFCVARTQAAVAARSLKAVG